MRTLKVTVSIAVALLLVLSLVPVAFAQEPWWEDPMESVITEPKPMTTPRMLPEMGYTDMFAYYPPERDLYESGLPMLLPETGEQPFVFNEDDYYTMMEIEASGGVMRGSLPEELPVTGLTPGVIDPNLDLIQMQFEWSNGHQLDVVPESLPATGAEFSLGIPSYYPASPIDNLSDYYGDWLLSMVPETPLMTGAEEVGISTPDSLPMTGIVDSYY